MEYRLGGCNPQTLARLMWLSDSLAAERLQNYQVPQRRGAMGCPSNPRVPAHGNVGENLMSLEL